MANIEREDIHRVSRHSNWSEQGVDKMLKEEVYQDVQAWRKFLLLFFIGLGFCFTSAGIIFFFAYNWADMHKFVKIGLIEALVVSTILFVYYSKFKIVIKNILLSGAAVLVGVLFAVFGQIYQTGANAYDFFLGWTLMILLWVIVSNFTPLWLMFILLINTTISLYTQQVANDWSALSVCTLLFILNVLFLFLPVFYSKYIREISVPHWFSNTLALFVVFLSTTGISVGIFEEMQTSLWVLIFLTLILYTAGIVYAFRIKSIFYLSIIPFSVIIILSCLLMKISKDELIFLLTSIFIVGSVSLTIKNLINLQRKWTNE